MQLIFISIRNLYISKMFFLPKFVLIFSVGFTLLMPTHAFLPFLSGQANTGESPFGGLAKMITNTTVGIPVKIGVSAIESFKKIGESLGGQLKSGAESSSKAGEKNNLFNLELFRNFTHTLSTSIPDQNLFNNTIANLEQITDPKVPRQEDPFQLRQEPTSQSSPTPSQSPPSPLTPNQNVYTSATPRAEPVTEPKLPRQDDRFPLRQEANPYSPPKSQPPSASPNQNPYPEIPAKYYDLLKSDRNPYQNHSH